MIFLFLLFVLAISKYTYKHTIKTNITNKSKLLDNMKKKKFFDLYLKEVKAENILFEPTINEIYLNNKQIIKYKCIPIITYLPFNIPKMSIKQNWTLENDIFSGKISCNYIDFDIKIELLENNSYIDIIIIGSINKKLIFVPNIALNYAIYDYENIYKKILLLMDI